jgi:hypothetical protein
MFGHSVIAMNLTIHAKPAILRLSIRRITWPMLALHSAATLSLNAWEDGQLAQARYNISSF